MLKLRLQRRGKRNYATYRVIVAEQQAPVKGRFVADVGFYNPHTNEFKVDADQVSDWMTKGAQPSDTVHNLLVTHGLLKEDKVMIWQTGKKKKSEAKAEANGDAPAKEEKKDEATEKAEATESETASDDPEKSA